MSESVMIDLRKNEPEVRFPKKTNLVGAKILIALGAILAATVPWWLLLGGISGGVPTSLGVLSAFVFGFGYGGALLFMGIHTLNNEMKMYRRKIGVAVIMPWDSPEPWVPSEVMDRGLCGSC